MKCSSCGAENPKKNKFCKECGQELSLPTKPKAAPPASPPPTVVVIKEEKRRRSVPAFIWILLGMILAVLLCGLLIWLDFVDVPAPVRAALPGPIGRLMDAIDEARGPDRPAAEPEQPGDQNRQPAVPDPGDRLEQTACDTWRENIEIEDFGEPRIVSAASEDHPDPDEGNPAFIFDFLISLGELDAIDDLDVCFEDTLCDRCELTRVAGEGLRCASEFIIWWPFWEEAGLTSEDLQGASMSVTLYHLDNAEDWSCPIDQGEVFVAGYSAEAPVVECPEPLDVRERIDYSCAGGQLGVLIVSSGSRIHELEYMVTLSDIAGVCDDWHDDQDYIYCRFPFPSAPHSTTLTILADDLCVLHARDGVWYASAADLGCSSGQKTCAERSLELGFNGSGFTTFDPSECAAYGGTFSLSWCSCP